MRAKNRNKMGIETGGNNHGPCVTSSTGVNSLVASMSGDVGCSVSEDRQKIFRFLVKI